MYIEKFTQAIHDRSKLRITYYAQKHKHVVTRKCAPLDYSTGKLIKDNEKRFWVWDYEGTEGAHLLPVSLEMIHSMEILDETFEPKDVINIDWFNTREKGWQIPRDWGEFS